MIDGASTLYDNGLDRHALIVCDMQEDLLGSLDRNCRSLLVECVRLCVERARQANWTIVFTGVCFSSDYSNVPVQHRIYGAFRRLYELLAKTKKTTITATSTSSNETIQKSPIRFFCKGEPGCQIEPSLQPPTTAFTLNDESDGNESHFDKQSSLPKEFILWRNRHLPTTTTTTTTTTGQVNWMDVLYERQGITHVTIVGIKAAYAVQAFCQFMCDYGKFHLSVIQECVQDDSPQRLQAILQHLIPIYATLCSLNDVLPDDTTAKQDHNHSNSNFNSSSPPSSPKYFCDCGRSGHFPLYASHLQARHDTSGGWIRYPTQDWYNPYEQGPLAILHSNSNDATDNACYLCPLGKRVVDFCDEPQFSRISMFLQGREWLDEKDKILRLLLSSSSWQQSTPASSSSSTDNNSTNQQAISSFTSFLLPETHLVELESSHRAPHDGRWKTLLSSSPRTNETLDDNGPWFVKDSQKNGGRAVQVFPTLQSCQSHILQQENKMKSTSTTNNVLVVQQHVPNPLLTESGQKCHIKFYSILLCTATASTHETKSSFDGSADQCGGGGSGGDDDDDVTWKLWTYQNAFLSVAEHPWSPDDLRPETQITVVRHKVIRYNSNNNKNDNNEPMERPYDSGSGGQGLLYSNTTYSKCQKAVEELVRTAIDQGKIRPRDNNQIQFEIFSTDLMLDKNGQVWLIECNFTPVLYDPVYATEHPNSITTPGLRRYHQLFHDNKNSSDNNHHQSDEIINDRRMIADVVSLMFASGENNARNETATMTMPTDTRWDLVFSLPQHSIISE